MKYFLPISLFCFFIFNSCKKYKSSPDAFFIRSSDIKVAPTAGQGSASHRISDLFLYVNGQFQGAYKSGNTMPIVARNQTASIDIYAGIKNNGIKDASITWVFYDKIHFDTLLETGKTIDRTFTFKYAPGVVFAWLENFDGNGISLVKALNYADTAFMVNKMASPGDSFEGKTRELGLTGVPSSLAGTGIYVSSLPYALPPGNSNVYLELNYKCNTEFEVGVTGDDVNFKAAMTVNAKSDWNKIYIQLADAVNLAPTADKHKVYFKIVKQPNGLDEPRVWLDNIKLVYL